MIYSNKYLLNAYKEAGIMHFGIFFPFETGLPNGLTTCFINPGLGPRVPDFNKCRCNSPAQSTKWVKESVVCGHSKAAWQVTEVQVVWEALIGEWKELNLERWIRIRTHSVKKISLNSILKAVGSHGWILSRRMTQQVWVLENKHLTLCTSLPDCYLCRNSR